MKRFMVGHFKEGYFVSCMEVEKFSAYINVKEGIATEEEALDLANKLNVLVEAE
jgi:hypothetical protein